MPAWLTDPLFRHNRGNTMLEHESSQTGFCSGLDDLANEDPKVIAGMVGMSGGWIDRFGVDGLRIDHAPRQSRVLAGVRARNAGARQGQRHFQPPHLWRGVRRTGAPRQAGPIHGHRRLPAVLDFSFRQAALEAVAGRAGTRAFEALFDGEANYARGFDPAAILPTSVSDHDNDRFATFVRQAFPQASDEEGAEAHHACQRADAAQRAGDLSGDEQGFVGDGNDQDAREDMFASKVASYNDHRLLGPRVTAAVANVDERHPLYRQTAEFARLRLSQKALTRGRRLIRARGDTLGLFAMSRFDLATGKEVLLAFNTSDAPLTGNVQVETGFATFRTLAGSCASRAPPPESVSLTLPAFGYAVCAAETR